MAGGQGWLFRCAQQCLVPRVKSENPCLGLLVFLPGHQVNNTFILMRTEEQELEITVTASGIRLCHRHGDTFQ